ncbi:hypothetical protein FPSE_02083 [Fusarium pseudograminearum CS3096]|uniref:Uncharacterized protein n=1 Tax=Fusarium pseudograminearum (strain CS3096) TaxID=1028729 RepID=K3W2G0_FUSPC|nr:hypothetical protein FPSE_02083 [Fusarium pseudograminearum CS3096]EKJ77585.1 hypothetical protein FPSE_02083 [Fusarium pseudograminearum CS3096]
MADQDTLRQFQEIKSVVAHYDATFANITPPQVVYKEEEARLRRQIHDEAVRLRTAQSDDETAMREDTIIELGGQMADLKRHYTANREKYAREHEVRLKQTLDMLRGRLGQLLGLSSTTQIQTTNGQEARDQGPPDQDQNQIPPAQENEAVGGESAQGSSQASQNAQTGTTANKSARRNAPNNENTEATSEPEGVINEGPTFNDQDDDHVHNHDKNDASNHEKNDNVVNGDESADIEMGDAEPIETEPIRHREQLAVRMSIDITPVSRNLRTVPLSPASTCDDSTTVRRDSQHLRQSQGPTNVSPRNIPPPTPRETRSKKRKALNSASTTQKRHRTGPTGSTESPLESAAEQSRQSTTRTSRRTTREHSNKSSQHASEPPAKVLPRRSNRHPEESAGSGKFEGIVDPKPGNVYATYWKKTKEWLAVVLLPMGDFSTVGIPGSIISCDLVDSLPPCYRKTSKKGPYVWAKGYRNGEEHEKERMFPVMFFDGRPFPAKSAIMWIEARELRAFDLKREPKLVPHTKAIRGYLKSRDWSEDEEDTDEESEEDPQGDVEGDAENDAEGDAEGDTGNDAEEDAEGNAEGDTGEDMEQDVNQDVENDAEEEQTRVDSQLQAEPGSEPPQQTDAEEAHETQPPEEETETLEQATEGEEHPNMAPQSPQAQTDQSNIDQDLSSRGSDGPPLPNRQETLSTVAQIREPRPESQLEEPASQGNGNLYQPTIQQEPQPQDQDQTQSTSLASDPSQHQTSHPPRGGASSLYWGTVTAVEPPNVDASRSGPATTEHNRATIYEVEPRGTERGSDPNYIERRNDFVERNYGSHLPVFQAPSVQNSQSAVSGPHVAANTQGQGQLIAPPHQSYSGQDSRQAAFTSQSKSSQPNSGQHWNQRQHAPLPPAQTDSSNYPSQGAHRIDNGQLQNVQTQQTRPPQANGNGLQNDSNTRSSHNPFHYQPMPLHANPQPYNCPRSTDTHDTNTRQLSLTLNSGNWVATEVTPPQQPPQRHAPLSTQNHATHAVPVSQQFGHPRLEEARPRPDASTAHQPPYPLQPQEPRLVSANPYAWPQAVRQHQTIDQPTTRTSDEVSQVQRPSYPHVQPAPLNTMPTYNSHEMPPSTDDYSGETDDSVDVPAPVKREVNTHDVLRESNALDEEIYAQRGHLAPGHPCFHVSANITGETSPYSQTNSDNYFPNGLRRYLQNLMSTNGLSPGQSGFGFETSDGKGYWCPFCDGHQRDGGFRSYLYRSEPYTSLMHFKQHLIKHWMRDAGPSRGI